MEILLIIIVGILALIAVGQAVRVFELSSDIKGEDTSEITEKDNHTNGLLSLIFLIFMIISFFWMWIEWDDVLLPDAASEHGGVIDNLWFVSMAIIIAAFLFTQPLLFGFTFRFRGRKGRKAVYMEHNNRLEFIWTIIPAVIFAGLIIYGLSTWSNVMNPPAEEEEPMVVEIYAKQFAWQVRYSGGDNELGYANVRLIEGANTMGVDPDDIASLDDVISNELHLPVNKPVVLKFRSQDVIHSAYLPHFRVQMNVLPGTNTGFQFEPTMTTAEMRESEETREKVASINELRAARGEDDWEFDYVLICNKICGAAHYNMQMKVVVEEQEEFDQWMSEQKSFAENL